MPRKKAETQKERIADLEKRLEIAISDSMGNSFILRDEIARLKSKLHIHEDFHRDMYESIKFQEKVLGKFSETLNKTKDENYGWSTLMCIAQTIMLGITIAWHAWIVFYL